MHAQNADEIPSEAKDPMPVVISLLRGVNVGGHNCIPMDALRALYASLDLRDARTYVQSGNVIFRTDENPKGAPPLAGVAKGGDFCVGCGDFCVGSPSCRIFL